MTKAYWHIHHDVLMEFLTEPIQKRIRYIERHKRKGEVRTRLRLLKPVKGKLPKSLVEAGVAYCAAWFAYWKSQVAKRRVPCDTLRDTYVKALATGQPKLEALHKLECLNCPWDGNTIFPTSKARRSH